MKIVLKPPICILQVEKEVAAYDEVDDIRVTVHLLTYKLIVLRVLSLGCDVDN